MRLSNFFALERNNSSQVLEPRFKDKAIHCPKKEDLCCLLSILSERKDINWGSSGPYLSHVSKWEVHRENTCIRIEYEEGLTPYEGKCFSVYYGSRLRYMRKYDIIPYSDLEDLKEIEESFKSINNIVQGSSMPDTLSITIKNATGPYITTNSIQSIGVNDTSSLLNAQCKKIKYSSSTSPSLFCAVNEEKLTEYEKLEVSIYRLMDDPDRILNQFRLSHLHDEGVSGIIARAVNEILPDYVRLKNKQEEK